jgi:hypothetical protein
MSFSEKFAGNSIFSLEIFASHNCLGAIKVTKNQINHAEHSFS